VAILGLALSLCTWDGLRPKVAGAAALVAFGAFLVVPLRRLLDPRPGLRICASGVFDHSSGPLSTGFIPWADVAGFQVFQRGNQRLFVIRVRPLERYVERGGPLRRLLNRANARQWGSPVVLLTAALDAGVDDLLALLEAYRAKYGG
jgi:hypothetical protein